MLGYINTRSAEYCSRRIAAWGGGGMNWPETGITLSIIYIYIYITSSRALNTLGGAGYNNNNNIDSGLLYLSDDRSIA